MKICDKSAYDIICRSCCQTLVRVLKKAIVSSRTTVGAYEYLDCCIIYKVMKSNLSQIKDSVIFFFLIFLSPSLFLQSWLDRKNCISVVWLLYKRKILYLAPQQCFVIQRQLIISHFIVSILFVCWIHCLVSVV